MFVIPCAISPSTVLTPGELSEAVLASLAVEQRGGHLRRRLPSPITTAKIINRSSPTGLDRAGSARAAVRRRPLLRSLRPSGSQAGHTKCCYCDYGEPSPASRARTIADERSATCSFAKMLDTLSRMAFSLRERRSAMVLLLWPAAIRLRTSCSRLDKAGNGLAAFSFPTGRSR
jgi:hypothetical protein